MAFCILTSMSDCEKLKIFPYEDNDVLISAEVNDTLYKRNSITYYRLGPANYSHNNDNYYFLFGGELYNGNDTTHISLKLSQTSPFETGKEYSLTNDYKNSATIYYQYIKKKNYQNNFVAVEMGVKSYDSIDGNIVFSKIETETKGIRIWATFSFTAVCELSGEIINVTNGHIENLRAY